MTGAVGLPVGRASFEHANTGPRPTVACTVALGGTGSIAGITTWVLRPSGRRTVGKDRGPAQ
jgi:hypothetical protein